MSAFAVPLTIVAAGSALALWRWTRQWEAVLRRSVVPVRTDER
jgi:hypothetical protein